MKIRPLLISCVLGLFLVSCKEVNIVKPDYAKLPAINENGTLNMVVEIPAGTNHKYEYDYGAKEFRIETINGNERVVDFLPYPGNYGFIPHTLSGDGDPVDVLVVGRTPVMPGAVMAVRSGMAALVR